MTRRVLMFAALCMPGLAQAQIANAPIEAAPAYAPPAEPVLPHDAWVLECVRRMNTVAGIDHSNTLTTCEQWWGHFVRGGLPTVRYGYAIPVTLTPQGPICHTKQVVKRVVVRRVVVRHFVHHHAPAPDKRVKI